MTTIPPRLARATRTAKTLAEARATALSLYRDFHRGAPEACELYQLDLPPSLVRARYREEFERNRHIKDLKVINVLLLKGRQEYQELMNGWKMRPQLVGFLLAPIERRGQYPKNFMDSFLTGKDDLAVQPMSP